MIFYTPEQSEIMCRAVFEHGSLQQEDVAIEELAELQHAIIKHRRYGTPETRQHIIEEVADVSIMLYQLLLIHGFTEYNGIVDAKLQRLLARLNEEETKRKEESFND
jgi:hypothetical protein